MALKSSRLFFVNLLLQVIPETRLFSLKRILMNWAGAQFDKDVKLCSSARILGIGDLYVGKGTWIGHQCSIIVGSTIEIGDNVDIAPLVYIGTGTHKKSCSDLKAAGDGINENVSIGSGTWIGVRATILPNVTIGQCVTVGAGTLVNKDLQDGCVYVGVPARKIESIS